MPSRARKTAPTGPPQRRSPRPTASPRQRPATDVDPRSVPPRPIPTGVPRSPPTVPDRVRWGASPPLGPSGLYVHSRPTSLRCQEPVLVSAEAGAGGGMGRLRPARHLGWDPLRHRFPAAGRNRSAAGGIRNVVQGLARRESGPAVSVIVGDVDTPAALGEAGTRPAAAVPVPRRTEEVRHALGSRSQVGAKRIRSMPGRPFFHGRADRRGSAARRPQHPRTYVLTKGSVG